MFNLKFVNFSSFGEHANSGYAYAHINPNYLILKSFYKFKSPKNYKLINWTLPTIFQKINAEEFISQLKADNINILCFSLYIWNSAYSLKLMSLVKQHLPDIKIIVGGPDVYANIDDDYFVKHPFIDYAVYGDGEEAFKNILDSIVEKHDLPLSATNIVTKDIKYSFKVFDDADFKKISPYLECKADLLNLMLDLFAEGYSADEITIRYERSRGCPYSCTFCDWNSGLHNKVKRKTNDWKAEVDFLISLGVRIKVTDANWGLYKEDVDITRYIIDNGGNFIPSAVAKLNKNRVFEIFDILATSSKANNKPLWLVIALQDLDSTVLKNIDRPEIPWVDHKKMLIDFKNKFPETVIYSADLILGLPGQNINMFIDQLTELKSAGIDQLYHSFWEFLPNSPASKKEYQDRYNLKFKEFVAIQDGYDFANIIDVQTSVDTTVNGYMVTKRIIETMSADFTDILVMYALACFYNQMWDIKDPTTIQKNLLSILPNIKDEYKKHAKFISTSGIFGVMLEDRSKIVSINDYCNKVATYETYV